MKTTLKQTSLIIAAQWLMTLMATPAQAAVEAWVRGHASLADANDSGEKVVTDSAGNVIVAGYTDDGVGVPDFLIIKYSGAGVLLWTNRFHGPGAYSGLSLAVDANGSVLVAGSSQNFGHTDYVTIKYSSEGLPLWTIRYNGPANSDETANDVAVDGSGNVFVIGSSSRGSNLDFATVAYSSAGVPLWTNRYNGTGNGNDVPNTLAVDGSGNVFVSGASDDGSGTSDYATVAYSKEGILLWTKRYSGPGNFDDRATSMAVDGNGNVLVTGFSYNDDFGNTDYATIKYSSAGVPLWTNRFRPGNDGGEAYALAVDASDNVLVTGTDGDYVTIKYSGAGVPLWTNRYGASAIYFEVPNAIAVDGSGNVFVTGMADAGAGILDYATIKYSGSGVPLWTNLYNGPANSDDRANDVAVDGSGNVFVTGYSSDGFDFDYATIKYSGSGVPSWTNRHNGFFVPGGYDAAYDMAVDGSGNVVVTGSSATIKYLVDGTGVWTNYTGGVALAVDGSGNVYVTGAAVGGAGNDSYTTIKYSGSGVPLWTNLYNGSANGGDGATAIAVDGSGNVFVTGYSDSSNGYYDYATIKYSGAGMPVWTNRYNGPGNRADVARDMAVDGNGNVYVTGYSWATAFGNADYATVAYSSAGVPLWTNRYNGPGNLEAQANAIAVDGGGNVLVTGESYDGFGIGYATIKYSGSGVPLWTNRYNVSADGYSEATAVALDGSGNVFVTGSSYGTAFVNADFATVAYSGAGVALWTNRYNGPGNKHDIATAMAVNANGDVFVTGYSASTNAEPYHDDFATVAYSGAGVPLWTNRYNGTGNGNDGANAVAVDESGNVFVTGYSVGSGYATIKYSSAALQPIPLNYQVVGNQIVLSWTNAAFSLLAAPAVEGSYTNMPGATSPHTNSLSGMQRYYRLKGN